MKYKTPVQYGIISGVVLILLLLLFYVLNVKLLASFWAMILIYFPLIFMMIWGGITYRKEVLQQNSESFRNDIESEGFDIKETVLGFPFAKAFFAIFLVSVIATTFLDTFNFCLYKYIDPTLVPFIKEQSIESTRSMMEKFGTPDDKVEEAVKQIKYTDFTPNIQTLLTSFARSIVIGLIFSLIIAAFVSRNPDAVQNKS